jgi:hypothetical protein
MFLFGIKSSINIPENMGKIKSTVATTTAHSKSIMNIFICGL